MTFTAFNFCKLTIAVLGGALLVAGCGQGDRSSSSATTSPYGSVAAQAIWPPVGLRGASNRTPATAPNGVHAMRGTIQDSAHATVAQGTFSATPGQSGSGTLSNVPAGGNYTLILEGMSALTGGTVIYSGTTTGVSVTANTPTPVPVPLRYSLNPVPDVTSFAASPGDTQITLSWSRPCDPSNTNCNYAGVYIVRSTTPIVAGLAGYIATAATGPAASGLICDCLASGTNSVSFTDTGLTNATNASTPTYYYAAYAHDATVSNDPSTPHLAGGVQLAQPFAPQSSGPTPPSALTATATDSTHVALSWGSVTTASSYHVFTFDAGVNPTSSPTANSIVISGNRSSPSPATATTATLASLTQGHTYYFVVTAVSSNGVDSGPSNLASATPQALAPGAPTGLTATAGSGQVALSWNVATGAGGYYVYRSTSSPVSLVGSNIVPGGNTQTTPTTSNTTYTDTSISNGTSYFYVVVASNGSGLSGASNQVSATPSLQLPNPPSSVTVTSGPAQVSLSWSPPLGGATGFNIYWGTSVTETRASHQNTTNVANGNATTQTITGLTNGSTYYFTMTATNAGGESGESLSASGIPSAPNANAPTAVTAVGSSGQVGLSWNPVSGAFAYYVYRATSSSSFTSGSCQNAGSLVPSCRINNGSTVSGPPYAYIDTSVTNGTSYFYLVTAVTPPLNESLRSNLATATPQAPLPDAPTGLTASAGNANVQLTWTPVGGATSYNVYRAGTSTVNTVAANLRNTVTAAAFSDTSVTNGSSYFYVVTAVNSSGTSGPSNLAAAAPQVAPAGAPTGLTASAANGVISLTWTAGTNATSTRIYRGTSTTGVSVNSPLLATVQPPTGSASSPFQDFGVTNGTTYLYIVTGLNAGGESSPSNQASASPQVSAPGTPQGVTASPGASSVQLSWTPVTAAASYNVYYGTSATQTPSSHGSVVSASTPSSSVTSLTPGTSYFFAVTAVNSGGESGPSATVSATPTAAPAAPTWNSPTPGTNSITLSFASPAGATSGTLYYGTSPSITATSGAGVTLVSLANNPIVSCNSSSCVMTITGLAATTTYYFVVTASNSAGTSPPSATLSAATTNNPPPAAPTGVAATGADTNATVTWSQVTGATGYNIYYGPAPTESKASHLNVLASISGSCNAGSCNSGLMQGFTTGTIYYFTVTASNAGGESVESTTIQITLLPGAPTGVTATLGGAAPTVTVTVAFSTTTGRTYTIYRNSSTSSSCSVTTASTRLGVQSSGFVDVSISSGLVYCYGVTATANGVEGPIATAAQSVTVPMGAVTGVSAVALDPLANPGTIQVSWAASPGASGYTIRNFGTSQPGPTNAGQTIPVGSSVTSNNISGLTPGSQYFFTVTASNASGPAGGQLEGPQSSVASATLQPSAPSALTATGFNTSVSLSWIGSSGATSYNLYRNIGSGPSPTAGFLIASFIGSTSYQDSGLTNGTTYYYVVTAVDSGGEGLSSTIASAIPNVSSQVLGAPTGVNAVASNQFVTLSFVAPPGADSNTTYNVYYGTSPVQSPTVSFQNSSIGNTSTTLGFNFDSFAGQSLQNGTAYYFAVTANNTAGQGAASIPEPSVPRALYAVSGISYNPQTPDQGTSQVFGQPSDDVVAQGIPIGFNFVFFGQTYSSMWVSSNGLIGFGNNSNSGCCAGGTIPSGASIPNIIALAWTDLYVNTGVGESVTYGIQGTAPNRKFIVSYNSVSACCGTTNDMTSQAILYEGTNVIEIHTANLNVNGRTVTQGIQDSTGSDAAFLAGGRVASSFTLSNDGVRFTPAVFGGWENITYAPELGSFNSGPNDFSGPFANTLSMGDDQVIDSLPVGFNFTFFGNVYSSFWVSSNGYMGFGSSANAGGSAGCCNGGTIPLTTFAGQPMNNFIAFSWVDLIPPVGGTISYETRGSSPNRRLVMNFSQVPAYGDHTILETVQTILYEGSNRIEIHAGNIGVPANYVMTIGIEDSTGTVAVPKLNAGSSISIPPGGGATGFTPAQ